MVTIEDLLKLPVFQGATLVAGVKGVDHPVRYVDIAEVPDVCFWINPDVFILTTAYAFHKDARALMVFMESLVKNNAAGLGIKLGRFLDELPQEFCDYADRFNLPIVLLPSELRYTYAIRDVTEAILEDERSDALSVKLDDYFAQLLFGDSKLDALAGFEAVGFNQSTQVAVVVISGVPSQTYMALAALKGLTAGKGGFAAIVETSSETIMLTRTFVSSEYDLSHCVHFFPEGVYAAVGREHPLREVHSSYDEAVWVLRLLRLFSSPRGIYSFAEMELFLPLLRGPEKAKNMEAALRLLVRLIDYDEKNHTALLQTLWIFALCDRDHKKTAERLHLHRNSLRYRLCKIERLLPEGSLKGAAFHRLFIALIIYFCNCAP